MDCTSECHQKWFWRWDAEKTEEEMLLEMLLGDGGSD